MRKWNLFKLNIKAIALLTVNVASAIFSTFCIVLTFIPFDEMNIKEVYVKVIILVGIVVLSFIVSTVVIIFFKKKTVIWSRNKNTVIACYGDLMKISFRIKEKSKRIVVIPVNDYFDTIVEETGEKTDKPLISSRSVHGMWIKEICNAFDIDEKELQARINANLDLQKVDKEVVKREKGNIYRYKLGSVAVIDGINNTVFYLLAISHFDDNNTAHATKKEIRGAIDSLIEYYDEHGQGAPMYMPLMGTGLSRSNLTHKQSLSLIKSSIFAYEDAINGSMNVVVYDGDKDKVSIFR